MPRKRSSAPASSRGAATPIATPGWWRGEGEEDCPHCEQTYSYEVEARCTRCDAAICLHCVTRRGKTTLCPDCARRSR